MMMGEPRTHIVDERIHCLPPPESFSPVAEPVSLENGIPPPSADHQTVDSADSEVGKVSEDQSTVTDESVTEVPEQVSHTCMHMYLGVVLVLYCLCFIVCQLIFIEVTLSAIELLICNEETLKVYHGLSVLPKGFVNVFVVRQY